MKILVTGFDPFGGESVNPSFEAVKLLPQRIGGAEIIVLELPTSFGKCAVVLREAIENHKPNAVLCVGQAGGRAGISIEKVAINLMDARIPDNDGNQPLDEPIIPDSPTAYFANLPIKDMVGNIKRQGIPAHISYSAGTFVCNAVMYYLLHMTANDFPDMLGGFIHVPYDTAQVVDKANNTPGMPVTAIAKGLEYAVLSLVGHI